MRTPFILGLLFIISAVVLGAFGAHGLKNITSDVQHLNSFETAVRYQMYGGILLLLLPLILQSLQLEFKRRDCRLFVSGIVLFSGSIYGLTLAKIVEIQILIKVLGPLTPIGGLLQIVALCVVLNQILRAIKE
jgi:uncharacterized membrane protein YgdD (TMEM256/DUF423 family)